MSMLRMTGSLAALAIALAPGTAAAQSDTSYYAGSFLCGNNSYSTEWHFTKRPNGDVVARIFYQYVNGGIARWIELIERNVNGTLGLYDGNGTHSIAVTDIDGEIHGEWLNNRPDRDCTTFIVARSDDTRTRFEEIFSLLESESFDEDTAAEIGTLTEFPPIFAALPELDQQSYARRLDDLQRTYWQGYREHTSYFISSASLDSSSEQADFTSTIHAIFDGGLAADARSDGYRRSKSLLVLASDRYVVAGGDVVSDFYLGGARTCERLQDIFQHHRGYDFGKVEVAAALPTDFWTREIADELLTTLRSCDGVPDDYTRNFANIWSEIEQRRPVVQTLLSEQGRLLALPATIETIVETRNLEPTHDQAAAARRLNQYDRFFGDALASRRAQILEIVLQEIGEGTIQISSLGEEAAVELEGQCQALGLLLNASMQQRDQVRVVCAEARSEIDAYRSSRYVAEIEEAFATARAGDETADAAREICREAQMAVSVEAGQSIRSMCSENVARLDAQEQALRCEQALANSGASTDLLARTIQATSTQKASIEDLICSASARNTQISTVSEGMLMWQSHHLIVSSGGNAPDLRLELIESESDADFEVAVTDEATLDQFQYFIVGPENFAACFLGLHPSCSR